jgi:TM2 domain-containing membrane protein YozV
MKNKKTAALLAIFLGMFGVHRFYLGQIWLGILYLILLKSGNKLEIGIPLSMGLAWLDAIIWYFMSTGEFDLKYNPKYVGHPHYERMKDKEKTEALTRQETKKQEKEQKKQGYFQVKKDSADKIEGLKRYKNHEYEAAIAYFEKALQQQPDDNVVHFNLACAHSLCENTDKSFYHLSKAVQCGFKDLDQIKTHEGLAYLRVQPDFDDFVKNGYLRIQGLEASTATPMPQINLLEHLKHLVELRERGAPTEPELQLQKKKLLAGN